MDGRRFDDLAKALAGGATRRGVLRGVAGGLAAAAGLRLRGARAGQAKKPLCHATGDPANPWVVVDVAEPSWDTHFAHGDTDYVDCCADADCGAGEACVDGACTPTAACCPPELGFGGQDPATGACVCAPGFPVNCGALCCPAGETCVATGDGGVQCGGETEAGQGGCQGGCPNCAAFCAAGLEGIYPPGSTCCARALDFTCCPPNSVCTPFGGCCCPAGADCVGAPACAC